MRREIWTAVAFGTKPEQLAEDCGIGAMTLEDLEDADMPHLVSDDISVTDEADQVQEGDDSDK